MSPQAQQPGPSRQGSHSDNDDSREDQPGSGLKKKRIQQACRPCSIKRVKCDGSNPCNTCIRSGEVCEYGQPKKRGPPKGSTRGGSKAAKRKTEARESTARRGVYDQAAVLPIQSTRDYAPNTTASRDANTASVPLSRPRLSPPFSGNVSNRHLPSAHAASQNDAAPASSRYPPAANPYAQPYSGVPSYHAGPAPIATYRSDAHVDPYPYSGNASPESSFRTASHRTAGSIHDGSVGSPNDTSSPGYYPPHSYPSRYDPASASLPPHRQRTETLYRGSSSGLGFIRPPPGSTDRRLPPLDFQASRTSNRSSTSPNNYGRLPTTSDPYQSALSARPGANRPPLNDTGSYTRPSQNTSSIAFSGSAAIPSSGAAAASSMYDPNGPAGDAPRYGNGSMQRNNISNSQILGSGWANSIQPHTDPTQEATEADKAAMGRPAGVRQSHTGEGNQLLVGGTLRQLQRDRNRDRANREGKAIGIDSDDTPEDIDLEPLLWVEPGDESRHGVNRSGVTLTKPEIPPLIQERLFTIFWGIVETIWPALYKPALCLTGYNVIDPEKHPMLHNAACALAAVAWDSGEFAVSETDTEATQSDLVERTVSDLSFSQGSGQLGDGTSLRRFSAEDLGDIFLARAKYYLVKTNNEPSLETIQSLLFMALREGGNGRASQASAYISTASRMCIDLGLHRQRDFSSVLGLQFSHGEEQARRRIFWCLYLLDKTSSASLGRPVTLRYAEIDCPLPNIDDMDEHETWAETTNNSSLIKDPARAILLKTPVAAMTHLQFGVRLGRICEEIIANYTHVHRSVDENDDGSVRDDDGKAGDGDVPGWETRLLRLHRKLEAWERDLPERLRFDKPAHRLPNTLSQHLWFQACKVMLHRPYILKQSSRPDLPPSHRICTDAVGSICDILTAYDHNFGMRKLSSTVTYCIFTASTIEIANTTSTDPVIALEAKRRLRKFMTWLSRMSGSWQSASHHLKILEQLGHLNDADLDGTGLPSHRDPSAAGSLVASRSDSPSAAANSVAAAASVASSKNSSIDVGSSSLPFANDNNQGLLGSGGIGQAVANNRQQQPHTMGGDFASALGASVPALQPSGMAVTGNDMAGLSVPGPIGAPMHLDRSRTSFQLDSTLQDDLYAQFQAQGQNPGLLYGWPATARAATPNPNAAAAFDTALAAATAANATPQPLAGRLMTLNAAASAGSNNGAQMAGSAVNPNAYLKLHDTSYWGAMPLASEDALGWANFTNSYLEALNGMANPLAVPGNADVNLDITAAAGNTR